MTHDSGTRRVFREIRDNIKACQREKSVIEEDSQNTVRAIQAHIQNLKEELDAYGQKLIKEVLENESKAIATLGKKIDDGERNEKALKVSMATLKQISERLRDVDIINKYDSLKATITEAKRSSKSLPVQSVRIKYKPLIQSIKPLMGRIQTKTSLKKPLDYIEICSLNFQKFVSAICPIDENKAWVGYRKFIQLCANDGSQGTRVDMEETVVSIATTSSGAIVVCCKASVKALLNKPAHKVLFHLVHEPSDMVVNENDNLIVCFKEAKKVTVFSIRGKPLQEMDVRNLGFRFGFRMNDPWKLALDDNQNVYLTDYLSETIVVYDRYFELKTAFASNVYRNASLCCSRGLLFVADYKRDCVQILSESGDLLQTCQTSAIGSPSSIAVDKTGSLWLGSLSGQVKVYSKR
ncbi:uncharacterized protein LOC127859647 [Dreissena polymorpha]|nr:uncharacterized protein LOC127859647 [Dreissena polymorpha]